MSRMSEIHRQMMEEQYEGDPQEYLQMYIENQQCYEETDILCPECMKSTLIQTNMRDYECSGCETKFIKSHDNSIKYKQ